MPRSIPRKISALALSFFIGFAVACFFFAGDEIERVLLWARVQTPWASRPDPVLLARYKIGFPDAIDKLGRRGPAEAPHPIDPSPKIWVIPFWIDPTGSPKAISKDDTLQAVLQAAKAWAPCGAQFDYQGFKARPEYGLYGVNEEPAIDDPIVSWLDLPDDSAGVTWTESDPETKQPTRWSIELDPYSSSTEADLLSLATHEFGHALGISHSRDKRSIMFGDQNSALHPSNSDVVECQRLLSHWDPEVASGHAMAKVRNESQEALGTDSSDHAASESSPRKLSRTQ